MIQFEGWPPPDWTEVIILWDDLLKISSTPSVINQIYDWFPTAPGGRYHIHGWQSTEGFAFRFENPQDATYFRLIWGNL